MHMEKSWNDLGILPLSSTGCEGLADVRRWNLLGPLGEEHRFQMERLEFLVAKTRSLW